MSHSAYNQRIVADDLVLCANNVRARRTAFFILKGPPLQPVVESRFTTLEPRQVMARRQLLWRADSVTAGTHLSHGALVLSSRDRRGLLAGGLSSMAVKRLNSSAGKAKYRRSNKNTSASRHSCSSMKPQGLRASASPPPSITAFSPRLYRPV